MFFTSPHPTLPHEPEVLGSWECKERTGLTILKPGVYWDDEDRQRIRDGKAPIFKARGINARAFAPFLAGIDGSWLALSQHLVEMGAMSPDTAIDVPQDEWPTASYRPSFAIVTAKLAAAQGRWEDAGRVVTKPVRHSGWPGTKRRGVYFDRDIGAIRSLPPGTGKSLLSTPYRTRPAQADLRSELRAALGIRQEGVESSPFDAWVSPDGTPEDMFFGALGTGQWR